MAKITDKELSDLIEGDARTLIKRMRELGVDFSDIEFDAKKKLGQEGYGLSESDTKAVDFVYWVAYYMERSAEDLIIDPQVGTGANRKTLEVLVAELSFGSKISAIENLYETKGDPVVKMMRKIQTLRNHVAHGRFDKLKYDGNLLDKGVGQMLIISDIKEAFKEVKGQQ